jgi:hypothetical protein
MTRPAVEARVSQRLVFGASCVLALLMAEKASAQTGARHAGTRRSEDTFAALDVTAQRERDRPCRDLNEEDRRKTERCKTEEERREDEQKKRAQKIADKEKPTKTSFWRRVHLDLPGIRAESGQEYVCCSLVGAHLTVAEVGRLNFYGPPGVLLVRQRVGPDQWQWRGGLSWGLGWYLDDVKLLNRPARLYFNLTKVWTTGGLPSNVGVPNQNFGVSMAGLSLVFAQ